VVSASNVSLEPDVSVVLPARNAAATVGQAVASVFAESGVTTEVLLVDDGSTDDTVNAARAVERHDERCELRVFRHPGGLNRGVAASRNLGLAHARARFVAFLDADDWLLPGSLISRTEVLRRRAEVTLVYGRIRSDSTNLAHQGFVGRGIAGHPASLSRWLLYENPIPTSTVMVRRCAVPESPFPEGLHHQMEDWAAWLTISQRGLSFFLDRELAVYRQTPTSWSVRLEDRWVRHAQLREEAELLRHLLEAPLAGSPQAIREAFAYRSAQLCVEAVGQIGRLHFATSWRCMATAAAIAGSNGVLARALTYWVPRLKARAWFGAAPENGPAWRDFTAS
jgi:glycosyltransferase involved in cell wall biosynthesis